MVSETLVSPLNMDWNIALAVSSISLLLRGSKFNSLNVSKIFLYISWTCSSVDKETFGFEECLAEVIFSKITAKDSKVNWLFSKILSLFLVFILQWLIKFSFI